MRLQQGANTKSGIVTSVNYAEFEVHEIDFADGTPDLSDRLVPITFSVQRGDHYTITEAERAELRSRRY